MQFLLVDIAVGLAALLGYQAFVVAKRRHAPVSLSWRSVVRAQRNAPRPERSGQAGGARGPEGDLPHRSPTDLRHLIYVEPRRLVHLR